MQSFHYDRFRLPVSQQVRRRAKHFYCITNSSSAVRLNLHNTNHRPEQQLQRSDIADLFMDKPAAMVSKVAEESRRNVRHYTSLNKLKLVGILASSSSERMEGSSDRYAAWISKTFQEDGIDYETWRVTMEHSTSEIQLSRLIQRANNMDGIHGILIYYPLFQKYPYVMGVDPSTGVWSEEQERICLNRRMDCEKLLERNKKAIPGLTYKTRDDVFRDSVRPSRDVEGLGSLHHNRRLFCTPNLYIDHDDDMDILQRSDSILFPCTALAVVRILKRALLEQHPNSNIQDYKDKRFAGITVTIINRSDILGRPLASMLANEGATVWSIDCDSIILYKPFTGRINRCPGIHMTLKQCISESSVIVTAVPSCEFKINTEWIQPNSIVVNVASDQNVHEEELRSIDGILYFTKIGAVTVAMLERNLVLLHKGSCT